MDHEEPGLSPFHDDDDGLGSFRAKFEDDPAAVAAYEDTLRRGELVDALRVARKASGANQQALAEFMGTTQSAVSEFETGRVEPQLRTLQRYARATRRRLDIAIVDPSLPTYSEETAPRLWRAVEKGVLSTIFTALVTERPAARTLENLAAAVDLDAPVLRYMLDSLRRRGWITTGDGSEPDVYSIGDRAATVIGLSIDRDSITGVLTDLRLKTLHRRSVPLKDTKPATVQEAMAQAVKELYSLSGEKHVIGVGACMAGAVESVTGVVKFAPALQTHDEDWRYVPLEGDLQPVLQREVSDPDLRLVVDNDANALAVYQYLEDASARTEESSQDSCAAVVLMTGTGVGAGFVVHGHVMYGANSVAGEGGHAILDDRSDTPCLEGLSHAGCLEALASARAVLKRVGLSHETPEDVRGGLKELAALAQSKDSGVIDALNDAGKALGRFLSSVVVTNDPGTVTVFGPLELADASLRSAAVFQRGVDEGMLAEASHEERLGRKTSVFWHALEEETLAVAAAAAVTRKFLYKPYHWVPAVLDPVPSA